MKGLVSISCTRNKYWGGGKGLERKRRREKGGGGGEGETETETQSLAEYLCYDLGVDVPLQRLMQLWEVGPLKVAESKICDWFLV